MYLTLTEVKLTVAGVAKKHKQKPKSNLTVSFLHLKLHFSTLDSVT